MPKIIQKKIHGFSICRQILETKNNFFKKNGQPISGQGNKPQKIQSPNTAHTS